MLKMSECIEILERNTPDKLDYPENEWLTDRFMHATLVRPIHGLVAIDKIEIVGKTDDEVKELVKNRTLSTLRELIKKVDSAR